MLFKPGFQVRRFVIFVVDSTDAPQLNARYSIYVLLYQWESKTSREYSVRFLFDFAHCLKFLVISDE